MTTTQEQLMAVASLDEPTRSMLSFIEAYWIQYGCSPTHRLMAKALHSNLTAVNSQLKTLEKLNLITVKRFDGRHVLYMPNLPGRVYGAEVS